MLIGVLAALLLVLPATAARASSTFFIRGGGAGHGIGMSQYGAYGYALHGQDYRFILAHYYTGTALATTNPGRTVRVLLATGQASFSGASAAGQTGLQPSTTYQVRPAGPSALKIVGPSGKQVGGRFSAPLAVSGPAPLRIAGLGSYRGSLEFRPDRRGGVQTVDAVGLDDYVRGVVAGEMPSSWSPQALEAQAVAARTYAITGTVGASGYDLYDDSRSQMYGGVGSETAATDAAVAATSGQIVTYHGQPAVTYFFSSSGGYTENIENAWPGSSPEPWLKGVPDPFDGAGHDPYHHWGSEMSVAAAAARLGSLVKGSLLGITVVSHGASPRIST
ncbi:MAG: SpoIID/LytB domain-containing protein, partial [Solirubrobacteraceae bacterium]